MNNIVDVSIEQREDSIWKTIYNEAEAANKYQFSVATNDDIKKVLTTVKSLLSTPVQWVKATYFKVLDNTECYCLTGAVYMACYMHKTHIANQVFQKLRENIRDHKGSTPWSEVVTFNDFPDRKYEEVLDLIDRTMATL